MKQFLQFTSFLLIFLVPPSFGQSTERWVPINPKPGAFSYQNIHIVDSARWIAKTNRHILLESNTDRSSWGYRRAISDSTVATGNMQFVSEQVGYIAVANRGVHKTTDGGITWQNLGSGIPIAHLVFESELVGYGYSNQTGIGSSATRTYYKTSNGGQTWNETAIQNTPNFYLRPSVRIAGELWDTRNGSSNTAFKSTDGGATWQAHNIQAPQNIRFFHWHDSLFGFAALDSGFVGRTTNGGQSWLYNRVPNYSTSYPFITQISSLNRNFVSALMSRAGSTIMLISNNFGESWETKIFGEQLTDITFRDLQNGLTVGVDGAVYKTTNAGADWLRMQQGLNKIFYSVSGNSQGRIWAVSSLDLYYSDNKGQSWELVPSTPLFGSHRHVHFMSDAVGFVSGFLGIFKTSNGGGNWQHVTQSIQNAGGYHTFTFINDQVGYASGFSAILKTTNGGDSWVRINDPTWPSVFSRAETTFFNENLGYLKFEVNFGWLLYKTTNGGLSWAVVSSGEGLSNLFFLNENDGWNRTTTGFFKTTNGGTTWVPWGNAVPWMNKLKMKNQLEGNAIGGVLFYTQDGGQTWTQSIFSETLPPNSLFNDWLEENGDPVLLVGDRGMVLAKENWLNAQPTTITGKVVKNENGSCATDSTELPLVNRVIVANPGNHFASSNEQGHYQFSLLPGPYQFRQMGNSLLPDFVESLVCPENGASAPVNILPSVQHQSGPDFKNNITDCPVLQVSQLHTPVAPCRVSQLKVLVKNVGTTRSNPDFLHVKLPPTFIYLGASQIGDFNAVDSTYRFAVPALQANASFTVDIADSIACHIQANPNRQFCIKATTGAVPACLLNSPAWDGVDLEVASTCLSNGTTRFLIRNQGEAMRNTINYRIFLDSNLVYEAPFQLAANNQMAVSVPATAPQGIYRLIVPQTPFHPLATFASAEANCREGQSTNGIFPQPLEPQMIDIFCVAIDVNQDPVETLVFPRGFSPSGNIEPRTPLRYTLRFQNTGTDTAFNVVVRDTLSQHLDIESFQLGAASHPCRLVVSGQGRPVLNFHFDNILLPDSNVNEPASNGQVTFTIRPKRNLPLGTRIENFADIYFDFNDPIRTNTTVNTLYLPTLTPGIIDTVFVTTGVTSVSGKASASHIKLIPNPASGTVQVLTQNQGILKVIDAQGRQVLQQAAKPGSTVLDISGLKPGIYSVMVEGAKPERLVVKP